MIISTLFGKDIVHARHHVTQWRHIRRAYKLNKHGYRADCLKNRKELNIVSIGCSNTFGLSIEDDKKIFPSIFCKKLSKKTNKTVANWNLGAPGKSNDYVTRMVLSAEKILKPDLFLIMFTASSRREHFDINGEMIDLFPNWRNGNPPFKKWNVYEGLEELINPNSDALNIYMNYKFIEMILEKHNIPWLFSSSGLGLSYAEADFMLNVIDNDKFIGDWIYSDMADDDKHPGEKSHQEISNLFFDKFKEEILGKHPSFL